MKLDKFFEITEIYTFLKPQILKITDFQDQEPWFLQKSSNCTTLVYIGEVVTYIFNYFLAINLAIDIFE